MAVTPHVHTFTREIVVGGTPWTGVLPVGHILIYKQRHDQHCQDYLFSSPSF